MDNLLQKRLDTWLGTNNGKPKIIVVYGPTACGKSSLAVMIGQYLENKEKSPFVVSVDARQIYTGLDIGTGKIKKEEMGDIPHFMLDIIDPSEGFSVVDFRNRVEKLAMWKQWMHSVIARNPGAPLIRGEDFPVPVENQGGSVSETSRQTPLPPLSGGLPKQLPIFNSPIPILCGGTGLYIDSLIFERSYPSIEADWNMRDELEDFRKNNGNEALWQKLNDIDPEYAQILHPNNYHYVMRGIEVMLKAGKSKLEHKDIPTLKYDTFFVTPYDGDREALYNRINIRVEEMFLNGLIEEVGYNIRTFTSSAPGLTTIGYREVVDYIAGNISLETCKALVQQHNRNYAKRQITWNKKYDSIKHP